MSSKGTVVLDEMIMLVTEIRLDAGAVRITGDLQTDRFIRKGTVLRGAHVHGSDGELVTSVPDMEITVPGDCFPGDRLRLDLNVLMDDKTSTYDPGRF